MLRFAVPLCLAAFLSFAVQPLSARGLLPLYGGAPVVWSACLVFFQCMLLVGYAWARALSRIPDLRLQVAIHLGAGALSAGALLIRGPLVPVGDLASLYPLRLILGSLYITLGAPFAVLAASAPLLQSWFSRAAPGRSPYPLYAASNAASFAALLAYPFAIEPWLDLDIQRGAWAAGYLAYLLALAAVALPLVGRAPASAPLAAGSLPPRRPAPAAPPPLPRGARLRWLALSAVPSLLLMASTHQLTQEVAPVPFLWLAPLALYLLTFVWCFEGPRPPPRLPWMGIMGASVAAQAGCLALGVSLHYGWHLAAGLASLTSVAMVLHGELARSRPAPAHLTSFYLWLSIGGAAGGMFGALVAPALFQSFAELPLALMAALALGMLRLYRSEDSPLSGGRHPLVWGGMAGMFWLVAFVFLIPSLARKGETVAARRNFFGVVRVYDEPGDPPRRTLKHGRIQHGFQFTQGDMTTLATSYYAPGAGVTRALGVLRERAGGQGLEVGIIGLGVGTLAAWGEARDGLHFYEINPQVIALAQEAFTYLDSSPAQIHITLGDGRLALGRELDRGALPPLDLLAVDAFSSDAIPVHLLTLECIQLYWRSLKPGGLLAIHVSNNHLDLTGVVRRLAAETGAWALQIDRLPDLSIGAYASTWMVLGRDPALREAPLLLNASTAEPQDPRAAPLWRDARSSLAGVVVW